MSKQLATVTTGAVSVDLADIAAQGAQYIASSKASSTVRAYRNDWNDFTAWCEQHGMQSLPATLQTVAMYIVNRASTCAVSTLGRRIAAISQAHTMAGHHPVSTRLEPLHSVWQGITRTHGTAQQGKAPAVVDELRAMVETLPDSLIGMRDRALLLLGFAGAFRRSEVVSLDVSDVQFTKDGAVVTLRKSKTDQQGAGVKKGIPYGSNPATCPVRAMQAWVEAAGITDGALFRGVTRHGKLLDGRLSDQTVALVVKKCAKAAGLDAKKYAGHSLRAGLATSAAAAGVSMLAIMNQTNHKSERMVRKYIRDGSLFRDNAAAKVGL